MTPRSVIRRPAAPEPRLTIEDEGERTAADEPLTYVDTRARAFVGVRFMFIRQAVILGMSVVGSTYLIRRIGPATWGGFATSYALLIALDNLLSHSLIAGLLRRQVAASDALVRSAARLCLIVGVIVGAGLLVAPLVLSPLYAPPHLALLFAATAICVILYSGRSLPLTLLERKLSYRVVAASEIADMLVFYLVAVPVVLLGGGAWGLAAGTVCRGLVTFGFVRAYERAPLFGRSPRKAIRELLPFGLPLCGVIAVGILDTLVPLALIGHHPTELGFLVVAATMLGYAVVAGLVVQRVAIPSFARLNAAEFQNATNRAAALAAFLTTTAMLIAGGLAPLWLVPLLGSSWHAGITTLQLVALGLIASGPIGIHSAALTARGDSKPVLHAQVITLVAYAGLGFALVALFGPNGAAAAYAASRWTWAGLLALMCWRRLGLRPDPGLIMALGTGLALGIGLMLIPHNAAVLVPSLVGALVLWFAVSHRQLGATLAALKAVALTRHSAAETTDSSLARTPEAMPSAPGAGGE